MVNQHKLISGYRDLNQEEIDVINMLKKMEEQAGHILADIDNRVARAGDDGAARWVSIARTHLETGYMYAIKAVARPDNGLGRE